ncbi:VTT domain-containing protein [Lapidilactobacillus bayanensis]|uniref:VTT domain-containing protein n=1 Tax=Lapidilactobacillus bayanensis TaxID=2485998 RepID=UPI000F777599|nr:VTT domain-containing protein [Lapidilactobacillus bayanensis]
MSDRTSRRLINIASLLSVVAMIGLAIYWYRLGIFRSQATLNQYIDQRHVIGPVIFILIQIIQVVIPIIPGGISTGVGVILFGPINGFIYNYVGIVIGSFINFFLARRYGQNFILHMIPQKIFDKYTNQKRFRSQKAFDLFFALAIFLPVAPDDVLVMIAGLTKMTWAKFSAIIIFLKPFTIAAYSFALIYGGQWLLNLIR